MFCLQEKFPETPQQYLFSCMTANLEPYECRKCPNFRSNFLFVLKHHLKYYHSKEWLHHAKKWLKCDQCTFKTKWKSVLRNHAILKHESDGKWFQCGQCSQKSLTKTAMLVHEDGKHGNDSQYYVVEKHNNKLWFHCGQCDFETFSKSLVKRHIWGEHRIANTGVFFECSQRNLEAYKCEKCPNFRTNLLVVLRQHVKSGHVLADIKKPLYKCECFETYSQFLWLVHKNFGGPVSRTTGRVIQRSSLTSTDVYKCPHCPFKSKFRGNLLKHFQKHTDWLRCDSCFLRSKYIFKTVKWYHCDICLFKTKRKFSLKLHHQNKHSEKEKDKGNDKLYECQDCKFKTKRSYNLKLHILQRHTQLENIQWLHCEHCEFQTKTKSILKRHQQEQHSHAKFKCAHCLYTAKSKRLLIAHLKSQHESGE